MIRSAIAGALLAALATNPALARDASATEPPFDPLAFIQGNWKIVGNDGTVAQDCDKAQHFELSPDRRYIILTEPWADFTARYLIIKTEEHRILGYIEGEKRLTEQGDPVLWWFNFKDPDHFSFRSYDWPANSTTRSEWVRCS